MQILGIDQYPDRWKRAINLASLLCLLLAVEGIIALIWLLSKPSEPSRGVFLGYSLERWVLVSFAFAFILIALFVLWNIRYKAKRVEGIVEKFEGKQFGNKLLWVVTTLAIFAITLMVWLPRNQAAQPYYFRLLPMLSLATIAVTQLWVILIPAMRQRIPEILKASFPIEREQEIYPVGSNKYFMLGLIVLSSLYLLLQIGAYLDVREAIPLGDTTSYFEGASLKLSDPAFFSERRPWGILLIFKMLGSSFRNIEIAQLYFSTFAWLGLAWTLSRSLEKVWGKVVGSIAILGFSLSPTVQVWNHVAMSESLTMSFTILILAVLVTLMQKWNWYSFVFLIPLFVLWMSIHEVNLYIGILVSVTFLIMGILRKQFRIYWLISLCIGIIFVVNYQLSSLYGLPRWALPVAEVITKRILPNQEYVTFFSSHDMPVTPELLALSGEWAHSDNYAIINSSEFRSFSKWLFNQGNSVYARFLITHPLYAISAPMEELNILLAFDFYEDISVPNYKPALPTWVNELFYSIRWFKFYIWLTLIAVGYIFVKNFRTKKRVYWLVLLFFLISIPYLYLTWHGDALGIARHAAIANVQFHLGVWLILILYLDKILPQRSQ